jgi:hypothetical protein
MKKTIIINMNGIVFHIDEDAVHRGVTEVHRVIQNKKDLLGKSRNEKTEWPGGWCFHNYLTDRWLPMFKYSLQKLLTIEVSKLIILFKMLTTNGIIFTNGYIFGVNGGKWGVFRSFAFGGIY